MCGIAGVINQQGISPVWLSTMSGLLRHRGPDDEGYALLFGDKNLQCYRGEESIPDCRQLPHIDGSGHDAGQPVMGLLHRRLSILDLTVSGHQPMQSSCGRYLIVYNGEVYNYRELRRELEAQGICFSSSSDTEVILAAYRQWGEEAVTRFVGMWALAILDLNKEILFLSRDRFGIKPLYYTTNGGSFAFASEIKALLSLPFVSPQADERCVFQYLSLGRVSDSSQTLFKDIREFPFSHNGSYRLQDGRLTLRRYYDLRAAAEEREFEGVDVVEEYRRLLGESVHLHLRSDVPVGSCLSGGLDSSSIVSIAAPAVAPAPFNTFTAAYHQADIDESNYAAAVADQFPNIVAHKTYPTSRDYWEEIDRLIWFQDLPIASTSMFSQWMVMRLAHEQGMKVLLDGQGADESLGGYSFFTGVYLLNRLRHLRFISAVTQGRRIRRNRSVKVLNEMGRAGMVYLPGGLQNWVRRRQRVGSSFLRKDFLEDNRSELPPALEEKSYRGYCLRSINQGLQDLLRYEDRNSMAFSIESRVPFLDHRLVEFSLALPEEEKLHDGWTKWVLRRAMAPGLPHTVTWRKDKKGFITPQKQWKGELAQQLGESILSDSLPPMLNTRAILSELEHGSDESNQLSEFWKLVAFLKWWKTYSVFL